LEAAATSAQTVSRSEFEELPYAHLKISSQEDLYSASGAGVTGDTLMVPSTLSTPTYGSPEDVGKAIEELCEALPGKDRIQTNPDTLQAHGSSENSYHPSFPHSVVVMAHSTEDVVKVVNISRKYKIPIIASGGATSLEGHFSGVRLNYLSSLLG
jgi:D-lactate dehydrogenase (cytochrome)